uniref:Uncharacterized protein n=2 Tax=Lygus hesperus TaxID=30085 RepID=A0A0K8SZT1_LYGHE
MKVLVLLALLCLGHVWGKDQSSSLEDFNGSVSFEEPFVYRCTAEEVIANSTQLGKIALDLISESFSVIYDQVYPKSQSGCPFGFFRCVLWQLNDGVSMIRDVRDKVTFFKDNVSDISQGIRDYFKYCIRKY